MAVLANNASFIRKEQIRATRDNFRKALLNAQKVRMLEKESGAQPEVNPCPHVKALTQIRRVKDDSERMALLSKFFNR